MTSAAADRSMHYISEGEYESWAGCMVRVPGVPSRYFPYTHYDTERACREAAIAYRNAVVRELGGWQVLPKRAGGGATQHHIPFTHQPRNKLGILGLHEDKRKGRKRRDGKRRGTEWHIVAQLRCVGLGDMRASFSVIELGRIGAIKAAVAAREEFEQRRDEYLEQQGRRRR